MSTAYHEAGHAVVAIHFEMEVESVTVAPFRDGAGETRVRIPDALVSEIEKQIIYIFAGTLAEAKHTGMSNPVGFGFAPDIYEDTDLEQINKLVDILAPSPDRRAAFLSELHARAVELLQQPHVWQRVSLVADALSNQETLTKQELSELL